MTKVLTKKVIAEGSNYELPITNYRDIFCDIESVLYLQKSLDFSSFYRCDRCFDFFDNLVEFDKAEIYSFSAK
ncbi:hypothetical protein H6G41_26830 [Tolypothrix sp. FACHB-123]|uniref:hypothetical protein n=1 Tax=Tolypothrix sp. FACHB-123 TaxID=2692868 RepID=UPI001689CBE6|nr:hypothetical protein [Tolypothrix sp. FACHB-123]MBD2358184.1 hypothetical protein [Tolypothrix sp. FACHB-123]